VAGVIVGKALYEGRFKLAEAVAISKGSAPAAGIRPGSEH
jgi:hypothetical protein